MEQWKPIKDYEGLYEVSDAGKVRSLKFGKVKELSPGDKGNGYLFIDLCKEGKRKRFFIHRLVVQAFISEIPKGLVVNHKDENKQNNNVDNLEICTAIYNCNYGSVKERLSVAHKGKIHSQETRAKMSESHKGKIPWNKGKKRH